LIVFVNWPCIDNDVLLLVCRQLSSVQDANQIIPGCVMCHLSPLPRPIVSFC
jgi:hypothetical protein